MDATELAVQRMNTNAFIAANPSVVTLTPRAKVIRGTGASWNEGPSRPAQVARLIDTQSVGGLATGVVPTQDGTQDKKAFQLLLPYDGVVEADDFFVLGGLRHEVTEILVYNGYEVRAAVIRFG